MRAFSASTSGTRASDTLRSDRAAVCWYSSMALTSTTTNPDTSKAPAVGTATNVAGSNRASLASATEAAGIEPAATGCMVTRDKSGCGTSRATGSASQATLIAVSPSGISTRAAGAATAWPSTAARRLLRIRQGRVPARVVSCARLSAVAASAARA